MKTKKKINSTIAAWAVLGIAICFCGFMVFMAVRTNRSNKKERLRETVEYYATAYEDEWNFKNYMAAEYPKAVEKANVKLSDLDKFTYEEYTTVHVSMWSVEMLSPDWYYFYFAEPIVYSDYEIETPQDLWEYLTKILSIGSVKKVYLNLDPYELYLNYYAAVYYDSEILTYEEYLENYIFSYFESFPEVEFTVYLPIVQLSEWVEKGNEYFEKSLNVWCSFMMFCHWYDNVDFAYMGSEEGIVALDSNFAKSKVLIDEVAKKTYLYMWAYDDYAITQPELAAIKEDLRELIAKEKNGYYNTFDFTGTNILFIGDSIFTDTAEDTLTVANILEEKTHALCYNVAIGGTCATSTKETVNSFNDSIDALILGTPLEATERYAREFYEFTSSKENARNLNIVICYGFNDYFNSFTVGNITTKDDISTYYGALYTGINKLKKAYPDVNIVLFSPYYLESCEGGSKPFSDGEYILFDYIDALENLALETGSEFINTYEAADINKDNSYYKLRDGLHPTFNTNMEFAWLVAEKIS